MRYKLFKFDIAINLMLLCRMVEFVNYLSFTLCVVLWVIYGILYIYGVVSHLVTAYSDPGIITRAPQPNKKESDDPFFAVAPPQFKQVKVKDVRFSVKWCETCNLYRPPRAVHCSYCSNCVHRWDHHCPWVGNCIGKRNYRYYLSFIFTIAIQASFVISTSILDIVMRTNLNGGGFSGFTRTVEQNPIGLLYIPYGIATLGFVGSLVYFHCSLVSNEKTTYEHMKNTYVKNPYKRTCCSNWFKILCPPDYPKYTIWNEKKIEVPDTDSEWDDEYDEYYDEEDYDEEE